MRKSKLPICIKCKKEIEKGVKQVQILTKNNDKIIGDENFHFNCWKDYFEDAVLKRLNFSKEKAFKIVGDLADKLGVKKIVEESINDTKNEVVVLN